MSKIELQFQDLQKAVFRLKEAAALPPTAINRDATIQRFEFTFELCWKLMNALVRENGIDVYGPRNTFRAAAQLDLIENPEEWFNFLQARNYTAHTYNEETAKWVYDLVCQFPPLVEKFLEKVKEILAKE